MSVLNSTEPNKQVSVHLFVVVVVVFTNFCKLPLGLNSAVSPSPSCYWFYLHKNTKTLSVMRFLALKFGVFMKLVFSFKLSLNVSGSKKSQI